VTVLYVRPVAARWSCQQIGLHYFPHQREKRRLVRTKAFALEPMLVEEAAWEMRASADEENVVHTSSV
jgi:hypothetical protein